MESKMKRDFASTSSGQPTQSKRPCFPPIKQEGNQSERTLLLGSCLTEKDVQSVGSEVPERVAAALLAESHQSKTSNGLESDLVPKSCSTEEDTRRVVMEQLERVLIPHLADLVESCIRNTLRAEAEGICSLLEDTIRRAEAVELANIHHPHLGRANANNGCFPGRKLQLRFRTKLSDPVYTGDKLEGEGRTSILVALIDADTGHGVTSGPPSIKLDVVVLDGDFDNDDRDDWAQEEFEKHMVKGRDGKGSLLTGDLQVMLEEGVAELGELTINDNSNWMRRKTFRIGVKVASDSCQNMRIREGKTNAFRVKEHRGEESKKHHPPALEDDVWRLEIIAKEGKYHQKLRNVEIHKVEDFLLQLWTDSKKLTEILGMNITSKNWSSLVNHAKTCITNWKLYLYYPDGEGKHGAIFNSDCQLMGIIQNRVYVATHRLSAHEKDLGDAIVKKALANCKDVRELNGETFSGSTQKKRLSSFPSQVLERNVTVVRSNLAPGTYAAPVGPETPPANAGSTAEGLDAATLALPTQSQYTNYGNAWENSVYHTCHLTGRQPISADGSDVLFSPEDDRYANVVPHDINSQLAMPSQMIGSSGQMVNTEDDNAPFSEPPHASTPRFESGSTFPPLDGNRVMAEIQSTASDDGLEAWLAGIITTDDTPPDADPFFQTPPDYVS